MLKNAGYQLLHSAFHFYTGAILNALICFDLFRVFYRNAKYYASSRGEVKVHRFVAQRITPEVHFELVSGVPSRQGTKRGMSARHESR